MLRNNGGLKNFLKYIILNTEGTIAFKESDQGFSPKYNSEELIDLVTEIKRFCKIESISLMKIDISNIKLE